MYSVLFCRSLQPMAEGANENTNGFLRKNFSNKTNFSTVSQRDLYWKGVYRINNWMGKIPGWKMAQECFAEELCNSAYLTLGKKNHCRFSGLKDFELICFMVVK